MRKKSILLGIILFGLSFMASATVIDTTLCKGKSITLTPRGDYAGSTLEWFQGGVSVSTNPYYTVTPNVSTVYELHVDGSATETFNVNVVNVAPTTMYDTACDSYRWIDGITYTSSTTMPSVVFRSVQGCDSTVTLNLIVYNSNHSGEETKNDACDVYYWKGHSYLVTGNYLFDTLTTQGCDSTVTLHLRVNHSTSGDTTAVACDSLTWHGTTYHVSRDYTIPAPINAEGCDSTVTLHLTLRQSSTPVVYTTTACDSYVWPLNNETYTASNNTAVAHLTNKVGCDSIVTLNLTVYNSNHSGEETKNDACDVYYWKGQSYLATGNYPFDTLTTQGCDSTVTLHLRVNHSTSGDTTAVACDSLTWHGTTYHVSRDYTIPAPTNAEGCDSTVTLHLTLRQSSTPVVYTTTACDSYVWPLNNETYTASNNTAVAHLTNKAGCDSTVTLDLTVYNKHLDGSESADVCDEYTWKNQTYYVSGNYSFDTLTTHGCDSTVTLHLTVKSSTSGDTNAVACDNYIWHGTTYNVSDNYTIPAPTNAVGCDSTVTLHLTLRQSSTPVVYSATACDSYVWPLDNMTYTASNNTAVAHLTNKAGCDSTVTLNLTVYNKHIDGSVSENACDNYTWKNQTYYASGIYSFDTLTTHGCDSTVNLHLTVNYSTSGDTNAVACDSFTWHGMNYSNSGDYTIPAPTNAVGCDSTVTLHLTLRHSSTPVVYPDTACDSYVWPLNNTTYTASNNTAVAHLTNKVGCDSIVTLNLTVYNSNHSGEETKNDACDVYYWKGQSYLATGNYPFDTLTTQGCDSTVTLNLTVNHSTSEDTTAVVCGASFIWHGTTYTGSGDYVDATLTNTAGCDSTVMLHLTLRNNSAPTSINETACTSYMWNGETYTHSGIYTRQYFNAEGCDSTVTLNLTIYTNSSSQINANLCDSMTAPWGTVYYSDGSYPHHDTTIHGCDSTVTLILTIRHSTSYTEVANVCDSYTWHGNTYTTTPSTYPRDTTTNTQGCDSVVTLNLTVRHRSVDTNIDTTVCDGFFIWDTRFTTTGNYQRTLINTVGCDSTINLDLTVKYKNTGDTSAEKCDRFDWYEYTDITSDGDYQHLFPDANQWGCDSTVTLHLTIKYKNTGDTTAIACDTFSWYEHVDRTVSGDYQHHFSGANQWGCDSTVTLHLTVNYKNTGDTTAVECDGFSWYEYSGITSSGDYQHLFADSNQWRCDSTVTLHLTIQKSVHTAEYDTACTSYTWHNKPPYEQSGTYIDSVASGPCMNTDTLHLHIYGKNRPEKKSLVVKGGTSPWAVIYPRAAGEQEHLYQWYKGDEPIEGATKQFYALPSENAGTTVRYKVWVSDINVLECGSYSETNVNYGGAASKSLRITPNPSNGHFEVAVEGDNLHAIRTEVYTLQGVCLMSIPMDGNYISVDSSLPQGSYLLRVVTEEGDAVSEKLIVR